MVVRIVTVDEVQFLTSVRHEVWGSNNPRRFNRWAAGEHLVFIVEKHVAGLAQVIGQPFVASTPIWDNGVFPYRMHIRFLHLALRENRSSVYPKVQEILWSANTHYGWAVFTQHPVSDSAAERTIELVLSMPNELERVRGDLDRYFDQALDERRKRQVAKLKSAAT
jgi:hypothetical protein